MQFFGIVDGQLPHCFTPGHVPVRHTQPSVGWKALEQGCTTFRYCRPRCYYL